MPFNSKAVANEFLRLAEAEGRMLTPMALIKLVYFAHGWCLALTGRPLLDENVEAWKYGPVVPSLYHEFKEFGNTPITRHARKFSFIKLNADDEPQLSGPDSEAAKQIIRRVWEVYKNLSPIQLSNLTHFPGSPWSQTPNKEIKGTDIPNTLIREYFAALANEQPAHAAG